MIEDDLIQELKTKGIFSEYLPSEFNVSSNNFNVYGAGASHKDRIEPYSYYMSRFNKKGDKTNLAPPPYPSFSYTIFPSLFTNLEKEFSSSFDWLTIVLRIENLLS